MGKSKYVVYSGDYHVEVIESSPRAAADEAIRIYDRGKKNNPLGEYTLVVNGESTTLIRTSSLLEANTNGLGPSRGQYRRV